MAFVDADAFATIAEVQAFYGHGTYSGTTLPTQQAVYDMKGMRSAVLQTLLRTLGYPYTVPSETPAVPTSGEPFVSLGKLLKAATIYGTIADIEATVETLDVNTPQGRSSDWEKRWDATIKAITDLLTAGGDGTGAGAFIYTASDPDALAVTGETEF